MGADAFPTFPTSQVFPASDCGAFEISGLRTAPQFSNRQPFLGSAPQVVSITNMGGAGAGAGILNNGSDADQSQGLVAIRVGPGQSGTPVLTLRFPAGIAGGQYVFFADWCSIAAGAPGGGQIALTLTPTRTLIGGELIFLAYQWAVST